ncbi:MAG: O-antigen ligase family protein [Chloroflexi bacterium]|nr:O-antigen ligase family protein [Chloroflexota bacterium]
MRDDDTHVKPSVAGAGTLTIRMQFSAWWLQWICVITAAPWLLLDVSRGWIGVCLLVTQQIARTLDASERQRRFDIDVAWPLIGLVAMAIVGLTVSPDIQISLPKFYGILLGIGVYTAVVSSIRAAGPGTAQVRRLWIAVTIYLVAGFLVAVASFLLVAPRPTNSSLLTALYDARPHIPVQIVSSHGAVLKDGIHPNEVAGTLTLFVPFYFALLLYRPWHRRGQSATSTPSRMPSQTWISASLTVASFVALVTIAGVLVSTLSRTAVVATMLSTIFLVAYRWRIVRYSLAVLLLGSASFVGLYLIGVLPFGVGKEEMMSQVMRLVGRALQLTRFELSPWGTTNWRIELWANATALIGQHPWTGIGLNALPLYLQNREARVIAVSGVDLSQMLQKQELLIPHAHNMFLQVALDLGIPGLVAFVALLLVVLAKFYRTRHCLKGHIEYALFVGISGTLLASLIFSMTDAVALGAKPGIFQWTLLGFAASLPSSRLVTAHAPAQCDPAVENTV